MKYCSKLAIEKAKVVSNKYPNSYIIGADTIVYCDKKILGKAKNYSEAVKHLEMLSNKKHEVYTAVSLVNKTNNY